MAFRHRCEKPLKVIADGEIRRIHESTLRVLDEVGNKFVDDETLRFLEDNGCRVDHEEQIVRFPASLVEYSLRI